jgi:hypothetical protein
MRRFTFILSLLVAGTSVAYAQDLEAPALTATQAEPGGENASKDPAGAEKPKTFKVDRKRFLAGYQGGSQFNYSHQQARGFIARVKKHKGKPKNRRTDVEIHVVKVLGGNKQPEPFDMTVTVYLGSTKLPDPSDQLYLIIGRSRSGGVPKSNKNLAKTKWYVQASNQGFIEVESTDDELVQRFDNLTVSPPKDKVKRADLLFKALNSRNSFLIGAATAICAYNRNHGLISVKNGQSTDKLARYLLTLEDSTVLNYFRRLYYSSGSYDVLPTDPDLIGKMIQHPNANLRTAYFRALGQAANRAEKLIPLLCDHMMDKALDHQSLSYIYRYTAPWGEKRKAMLPELEKIARGEAPTKDKNVRAVAVQFYLQHAEPAEQEKLLLDLLAKTDLATVQFYVARQDLARAVPVIIHRVRADRKAWDETLAQTLLYLTRRSEKTMQSWKEWDAWWKSVEQAGRVEDYLVNGFTEPDANAKVAELIDQLTSPSFRTRQAARRALANQPLTTRMPAVREAMQNGDTEIRNSLEGLIRQREEKFRDILVKLGKAKHMESGMQVRRLQGR